MNVLVVDDDPSVRLILRRVAAREFGGTVVEAEDGVEALEKLEAGDFGLVVIDLLMPRMSGEETLHAIKQSPRLAGIPIVVLTSDRDEHTVRRILDLGVADYLTKPIVMERAAARLRRAVSASPADRLSSDHGDRQPRAVLIADGDRDFRRFVAATLGSRWRVVEAESGIAALRTCFEEPMVLVLIGEGLGLLAGANLARKLRGLGTMTNAAIVRLSGSPDQPLDGGTAFDGTVARTSAPAEFLGSLGAISHQLTADS